MGRGERRRWEMWGKNTGGFYRRVSARLYHRVGGEGEER